MIFIKPYFFSLAKKIKYLMKKKSFVLQTRAKVDTFDSLNYHDIIAEYTWDYTSIM